MQEFRSTELKTTIAKMKKFIVNQGSICHGLNTHIREKATKATWSLRFKSNSYELARVNYEDELEKVTTSKITTLNIQKKRS